MTHATCAWACWSSCSSSLSLLLLPATTAAAAGYSICQKENMDLAKINHFHLHITIHVRSCRLPETVSQNSPKTRSLVNWSQIHPRPWPWQTLSKLTQDLGVGKRIVSWVNFDSVCQGPGVGWILTQLSKEVVLGKFWFILPSIGSWIKIHLSSAPGQTESKFT